MRPEPGQVLHFSEDPTITRFVPHVAATAVVPPPAFASRPMIPPPAFASRPMIPPPAFASRPMMPVPYVWAVGADQAPSYWFPRQCPRAMAWSGETTSAEDRDRILGAGCPDRVHAVEYGWLGRILDVKLYAYRLPAAAFRPIGEPRPYAMVATEPVEPLGPAEPVGDLLRLHEEAGIQLRLLDNLWRFWDAVTTSTVYYSGIRLRNARPRRS
jgi:hypothetical protein